MEKDDEKKQQDLPRTFMSKAYLVVIERKTYGLFRDITQECKDTRTGLVGREKVGQIGPIGIFRECEGDEQCDMWTHHPVEDRMLKLKKMS